MREDNNSRSSEIRRRTFTKMGGFGAFGALAGVPVGALQQDDETSEGSDEEGDQSTSTS